MYGRGPNVANGGPTGAPAPAGPAGVPGVKAEPAPYGANVGYGSNGYNGGGYSGVSYYFTCRQSLVLNSFLIL